MTKPRYTFADSARMARAFIVARPGRLAVSLALLLAAGLAEGLGFLTLLPVLGMASNATPDSPLYTRLMEALALLGLAPTLGILLSIIVGGVVVKAVLTLLAQRNIGYTVADVATELRLELIRALMQAHWTHFVSQPAGRVANAVATEATVTAAAYNALMNLIAMLFQVMVFSAVALLTSWQVTVVGLVGGISTIVLLQKLVSYARRAGTGNAEMMNSLLTRLGDGLLMIKPLKAMGQESRLLPILEADARAINTSQRQLAMASSALNVFQEPVLTLILAVGLYFALSRFNYPLPDLLFMVILFQRIVSRTSGLQLQYQKMVSQEASYWSIRNLIDDAADAREPERHEGAVPRLEHGIGVDAVSFAYGSGAPVLDRVSIEIPARQMTVIYGPSGTGKTTLADMVVGLLSPQSGGISVDGVPLAELDQACWRGGIGYVPQELILFHDSVFANVTLGDPAVSEDDVRQALTAAGAWGFVSALPDGMYTVAGERGARFSGGQRQRISLARALVRKPMLLILDEPTTALDPETERAICETLRTLSQTTTILGISHQRAVVEVATRAYRLEGGIVERIERANT